MSKYRKSALIEVVGITEKGYLVQNEGDSSDRWVIDPDTFGTTYEEVEDIKEVDTCEADNYYPLLEALKVSHVDDFEFRDKVKAKLEKILNL